MGEVHVLVNPLGGRGRAAAAGAVVRRVIEQAGHTPVDISGGSAAESTASARAAVAAGAQRLVVVGGDGTVHLAVQGVAGTATVLGIVPAGTGNDFARAFGLNALSIEEATTRALGPARPVDAIRTESISAESIRTESSGAATGAEATEADAIGAGAAETDAIGTEATRSEATEAGATEAGAIEADAISAESISTGTAGWVTFNVTGGFSVDVNRRADALRFPKGPSRYTVATLLELPGLRHRDLAITVDEQRLDCRSAMFAVANTSTFGGGMAVCPDADPSDGLLDVAVVGPASRSTLLRLLPKVFNGSHVGHRQVHMLRGQTVTIEGESMDLVGDGEPLGRTPIVLQAVPGALLLAAP